MSELAPRVHDRGSFRELTVGRLWLSWSTSPAEMWGEVRGRRRWRAGIDPPHRDASQAALGEVLAISVRYNGQMGAAREAWLTSCDVCAHGESAHRHGGREAPCDVMVAHGAGGRLCGCKTFRRRDPETIGMRWLRHAP